MRFLKQIDKDCSRKFLVRSESLKKHKKNYLTITTTPGNIFFVVMEFLEKHLKNKEIIHEGILSKAH